MTKHVRITERTVTRNGVIYQQETARLNNFVSGPELFKAVLAGAEALAGGELSTEIEFLAAIKCDTSQGQENLVKLRDRLPTPHRQSDVLTAVVGALSQLRQQAQQSYEGQCPHCTGAVYYAADLGDLFCEACEVRWPNARALAAEKGLTNIDEIIRTTLNANDPKWGQARHNGLNDQQLRDMIAHRWGRGRGQVNPVGAGYWVTGYPHHALWVGRDVLDERKRGDIPPLDGAELLTAVRAALRLPHGPETRYCRQCGTKEKLLVDVADAARPAPCPTCGANEAGLWLKNPPPANGVQPRQHSYILEEDQPHPCPQCGEKRVRGVNGSQRWCIGCGATWPTAEAFLADVATAAAPVVTQRVELTRRFAELVRHLSPAQLGEMETVIMRLETQVTTAHRPK